MFSLCLSSETDGIPEGIDKLTGIASGETSIEDIDDLVKFGEDSPAQQRIDLINEWLNENVSWLEFIFRMPPQVSLLFFFDFLAIMWGLVYLIINSPSYWETKNKLYNYLIGTAVFLIGLFINLPYYFARFAMYSINFVQGFVKSAVIASVIVIVIYLIILIFCPKLATIISKIFQGKKSDPSTAKQIQETLKKSKENLEKINQDKENLSNFMKNMSETEDDRRFKQNMQKKVNKFNDKFNKKAA